MTSSDAKWLVEEFNPMRKGTISNNTMPMFVKAINIILDQNRRVPGCTCEHKVTATIANSAYEQYESKILELYNAI